MESAKSSAINSGSNKINLMNVADDQLASMFRPLTLEHASLAYFAWFFLGSIFKIVSNKIVCLSFLLGLFTHGTRVKTGSRSSKLLEISIIVYVNLDLFVLLDWIVDEHHFPKIQMATVSLEL